MCFWDSGVTIHILLPAGLHRGGSTARGQESGKLKGIVSWDEHFSYLSKESRGARRDLDAIFRSSKRLVYKNGGGGIIRSWAASNSNFPHLP